MTAWYIKVVIPIQTISFYNTAHLRYNFVATSCHTYPNDKLLQQTTTKVVEKPTSCHTYPNDKLLQLSPQISHRLYLVVIPIQTISFYNALEKVGIEYEAVVIPIQTISFYNTATVTVISFIGKLSYLSKR